MIRGLIVYETNKLVTRWRTPKGPASERRYFSQGKRVGKDCPLTPEERKQYVQHGTLRAISLMHARTGLSHLECFGVLSDYLGYWR